MKYLEDYNFIITVGAEFAEFDACAIEAAKHLDRSDAVVFTYGMKDVMAMQKKDVVATEGSQLNTRFPVPAPKDSVFAHALTSVGGIFTGTTSLPCEFNHKSDTYNHVVVGQTRNPHNPDLTIGGSSGGSAGAVASGICHVATATDSAGSIVCPASFSGTVGIKLPKRLILRPLSQPGSPEIRFGVNSMSRGFFTRKVEDAAVVLDALSQHHYGFLGAALDFDDKDAFENKRIAYLPSFKYVRVDEQVASAVDEAVAALPRFLIIDRFDTLGFDDPGVTATTLWYKGYADFYAELCRKYETMPDWKNVVDPTVLEYAERGGKLSVEQVREAKETKDKIGATINDFFKEYDYLITPAMPTLPWAAGDTRPVSYSRDTAHHVAFSCPFSYSGNPSVVLPCGTTKGQLYPVPIGLQVVGRMDRAQPHESARDLLRFAALCERSFAYDQRPVFGALCYDYGPAGTRCGGKTKG